MRSLLALLSLAVAAAAAPTHVTGTLSQANGDTVEGVVVITWNTFTSSATVFKAGSITVPIHAGRFDSRLEPGVYTLKWGTPAGPETLNLYVPAAATVDLTACLLTDTSKLPAGDIAQSGASDGQTLVWSAAAGRWQPATITGGGPGGPVTIASVTGLQGALDAKATTSALAAETAARAAADTANASANAATAAALVNETAARVAAIDALTPFSIHFTAELSGFIPFASHHVASAHPIVNCIDAAGSYWIAPITVSPAHDITIDFSSGLPFTGDCTVRP